MSWFWSQTLEFTFNPTSPRLPNEQRAGLGPSDTELKSRHGQPLELGSRVSGWPGTLRVSVSEQYYRTPTQPLYRATLFCPDNGTRIAELDVPCVVPTELPIEVHVVPIRANPLAGVVQVQHVICTAWVSQGEPFIDGGTLWLEVEPDEEVPGANATDIPDWTGAVSVLDAVANPIMYWLDFANVIVGTFQGDHQPRPRRAVRVGTTLAQSQTNVPILCHWTQ
jgi:hypothetical protein